MITFYFSALSGPQGGNEIRKKDRGVSSVFCCHPRRFYRGHGLSMYQGEKTTSNIQCLTPGFPWGEINVPWANNPCNERRRLYNKNIKGVIVLSPTSCTDSPCSHLFSRKKAIAYLVGERCCFHCPRVRAPSGMRHGCGEDVNAPCGIDRRRE